MDIEFRIGRTLHVLNRKLIEKQGLTQEQVDAIKALHVQKHDVFKQMTDEFEHACDQDVMRGYAKRVEDLEFALQEQWGFTQDKNFHEWYNVPGCACPKMDNAENKGTPYRIITDGCMIHGRH